MSMHDPVVFDRLTRYYGRTRALDTVSLRVPEGSIFALLGRNGAGKTTALDCLLGFLRPTRGRALLFGEDAVSLHPALREKVGYVAEGQRLVAWMKVRELVRFQRAGFANFDEDYCLRHLRRLGLPFERRVFKLSRGMRAQLALSLALAQRPELMVLDDPAMGLDAVVRREFLEVMIDLIQEEGRTLLFTSHILSDVERVCDHVAILDGGVLRIDAPLDVVKARVRRYHALFDKEAPPAPALAGLVRDRRLHNELVLTVVGGGEEVERACRDLGARRVDCEGLSLEELFIDYTAGRDREGEA